MKKLSILAALFVLGGCAMAEKGNFYDDVDWKKVSQIEQGARAGGAQIVWVTYPTKPREK
ncbi:MAG: hypothetical protein JNM52_11330 [Betaproteobacteria bacterium]|nr:hypothetical protein [Betaproteobacteria bacterium]